MGLLGAVWHHQTALKVGTCLGGWRFKLQEPTAAAVFATAGALAVLQVLPTTAALRELRAPAGTRPSQPVADGRAAAAGVLWRLLAAPHCTASGGLNSKKHHFCHSTVSQPQVPSTASSQMGSPADCQLTASCRCTFCCTCSLALFTQCSDCPAQLSFLSSALTNFQLVTLSKPSYKARGHFMTTMQASGCSKTTADAW
jgi:hypothetical protein